MPRHVSDAQAKNGQSSHFDNASLAELVGPGKDRAEAEVEAETLEGSDVEASTKATIPRKQLFIDTEEDLDDELSLVSSCRVQQPPSQILFRVRPGKEWRAEALVVDFREEDPRVARGKYLIVGDMRPKFKEFGRRVLLVTCVSATGQVFLWDINIVVGFGDTWFKSDLNIVKTAEAQWTRFVRQAGNGHGHRVSQKDHGEPHWPGPEIRDIYDLALIAFSEERLVEHIRHPLCDVFEIE
jgi:hypothetical protein